MAKFGSGDRFRRGMALGGVFGMFRRILERVLASRVTILGANFCDVLGFMRKPWGEGGMREYGKKVSFPLAYITIKHDSI